MLIFYAHILCSYFVLIFYAHILCSYFMLIFYAHILCSYFMLIFYAHILSSSLVASNDACCGFIDFTKAFDNINRETLF